MCPIWNCASIKAEDAGCEAENGAPGASARPNEVPLGSERSPAGQETATRARSAWSSVVHYLIDIENAVIIDVEPTQARTYDEVESTKTMLARYPTARVPTMSIPG
jgi:hypothetical protein